MEAISGLVEHVIFHNADTGFTVLRVQADKHRDPITVVGVLPSAVAGISG